MISEDGKKKRASVYFDIREMVKRLGIPRPEKEEYTLFLSNAYNHLRKEQKEYLHSSFIKSKLGNKYREKLKFLEQNNIIRRKNLYIVGLESKGFVITGMDKFSDKKVKMYVDQGTKSKMKKKFVFSDFPEIQLNKKNLARLSIRDDEYHRDFKGKISNFPNSAEYNLYMDLLHSISLKKHRVTKRHESSRLFHFVTSIKKGLRYLLLADNEEVVEIDMSSAHFYFLSLHLSRLKDFKKGKAKEELDNFKNLVLEKNLYEFFLEKMRDSDYDFPKTRDEVKKRLLSYLYLNPDDYRKVSKRGYHYIAHHVQGAYEEMKKYFPSIHQYVTKISGRELQQYLVVHESKFMLRNFASVVNRDYPGLFYLNIHDAILCKRSEKDIVMGILNQLFPKNYKPEFKIENIQKAFFELKDKESFRKARAKKEKVKKISTLKVKVSKSSNEILNFKIGREIRIGDTKQKTLLKLKKLKGLNISGSKLLSKSKRANLKINSSQYRSLIGHGDFQINFDYV